MENTRPIQLFAIEDEGPRPLPVPAHITGFDGLYNGLELGVYSALRTFDHNKFLLLEEHIARTVNSARLIGWDYKLDEDRLRHALHEVCSQFPFPEARVRFDILASAATHLGTDSRELIGLVAFTPLSADWYETGVIVDIAKGLQRTQPLAKTADFAQKRRAYPVGRRDLYEYLLTDEEGYLLEGTSTNFYGVRHGHLHTAGNGVLGGITRQIILKLAGELQIPVKMEPVHKDEIPQLQEAAISGSSRGLLPVVQIGEQVVGDGRPGPICQRLLSAYNTFVSEQIKLAIT